MYILNLNYFYILPKAPVVFDVVIFVLRLNTFSQSRLLKNYQILENFWEKNSLKTCLGVVVYTVCRSFPKFNFRGTQIFEEKILSHWIVNENIKIIFLFISFISFFFLLIVWTFTGKLLIQRKAVWLDSEDGFFPKVGNKILDFPGIPRTIWLNDFFLNWEAEHKKLNLEILHNIRANISK